MNQSPSAARGLGGLQLFDRRAGGRARRLLICLPSASSRSSSDSAMCGAWRTWISSTAATPLFAIASPQHVPFARTRRSLDRGAERIGGLVAPGRMIAAELSGWCSRRRAAESRRPPSVLVEAGVECVESPACPPCSRATAASSATPRAALDRLARSACFLRGRSRCIVGVGHDRPVGRVCRSRELHVEADASRRASTSCVSAPDVLAQAEAEDGRERQRTERVLADLRQPSSDDTNRERP